MSAESNEDAPETVEHRAAYWHLRLTSDDCTPEDRYAFEAWKRQSLENADAYRKVVNGAAFIDRHVAEPELRRLAAETMERTAPTPPENSSLGLLASRRALPAIAAGLVLAVGLGVLTLLKFGPQADGELAVARVQAYETEIGERSTIDLPDGSKVTLNTDSRLEVRYSPQERLVALTRGQGYFDVAKDVDRPFAVAAGGKRVVALGTAFDVRLAGDNDVEVTLVEGRVAVDDAPVADTAGDASAAQGGVSAPAVELSPGERLVAKANAAPAISRPAIDEATAWREGRLIFRERPIGDVVAEMNRYNAQKLKLSDDDRVRAMKVSGVFNTGRASTFVDALERMHPLEARRSGADELTLVWQE